MNSFFSRCIVLLLSITGWGVLSAQNPITITVSVMPPYPNYVDEVMEMSDQTIITLQNADLSNGYSLKLMAELTGSNGITVRTKESALPSAPIQIGPGETVVMTGEEMSVFYNNFAESDFDFTGITRQDIINNQQLPDGTYSICLRAFEYQSGLPLSAGSPSGCSAPFVVLAVDPPIITYPQNETTLNTIEPQLININWIPVSISLPDVRYRVEMVDLTDFNMNPYDAFESGDFLFFMEEDLTANVLLYGMEYPLLIPGHRYALRVQAYRLDGPLNVMNEGYSDIVTFRYGDEEEQPTDEELASDLPPGDFECGQDCSYPLPSGQSSAASRPAVGTILDIGNFKMRVNSIQGDGTYKGTGVIQPTAYFPVGVKVNFKNLKVNAQRRVFAGEAQSVIRTDSWIDASWNDLQTAVKDIDFNPNTLSEATATLTNPDFYIENLTGISQQVGTTLPFTIGSGFNKLQVVGMHFFPDRASYNLSSIIELSDDAEGTPRYLNFMAKDLCISPGGIALSDDEARLELVKPVRYHFDNKTLLEFQPAGSGESAGTYLAFDCNGFNSVHASGKVIFSKDVFLPVSPEGDVLTGDTVTARFATGFTTWSDWVATLDFSVSGSEQGSENNQFIYKELEDYLIAVEHAFIDHSIEANPEGMVFPDEYVVDNGPDWQGVYLKTVKVSLPEWIKAHDGTSGRVHLTGSDLIMDGQGLTGLIRADNVLSQKEGAMGKWPITVDTVRVRIIHNSLASAYFTGGLKIPIIDEPFAYKADMQFLNNRTRHAFSFKPVDEYTIPMWYANTTIHNNSTLTVNVNDGSAYVEAVLNGAISFQPAIGDIDKMNLANITFQNFTVRSKKQPDYISFGEIGTDLSGKKLAVAGFGVLLESMEWHEETADLSSLDLGLQMDLSNDVFGISGSTGLEIKNSISDLVDSLSFDFEGVNVNSIYLEADAGVVAVKGSVSFFKNHEKFGNGFAGSIGLSFVESIKLEGSVLFGNVKPENGDGFNYWYAKARVYLPGTPVPMATPVDIYGFAGGVYKNLSLNRDFPDPRGVHTFGDPGEIFNVEEGILGFQASVIVGLTPSSTTFNADVGLTAEVNSHTGGVNLLALTGAGYVMQEIEEEDKEHSLIQAEVAIVYDFPRKTLSGNFSVEGRVPYNKPLLTLNGQIDLFRSPDIWYLHAGKPSAPIQANVDLKIGDIQSSGYFMTGYELEPPVIPAAVASKMNFHSYMYENTQNKLGIGFMAGIHMKLHVDWSFAGCGVEATGWSGVDLAVLNYFAATCNGSEDFGVNKWYAQGQAYLVGEVVLKAFSGKVASFGFGVVLEGAFPNPTGVRGAIAAWVDPPFMDEVKLHHHFQYGKFCDIQPLEDAAERIEREEKVLDNLPLLGYVTPANGTTNLSTAVKPQIQFYQTDKTIKKFTYGDGLGGIVDLKYRIRNEARWEKKTEGTNQWTQVHHSATYTAADSVMTLQATNANGVPALIGGGADYRIIAKSYIQFWKDNPENYVLGRGEDNYWVPATYTEGPKQGQPIIQTKTHAFNTGSNLTEIEELYVDYTLPYPRQRFYPYGYLSTGKIKFNVDHRQKFADFEDCGFNLYAEFDPVDGSPAPPRQDLQQPDDLLEVHFNMATLNPETTYRLRIVAERRGTKLAMMQADNDECSLPSQNTGNNSGPLQQYLGNYGITTNISNFTASSGALTANTGTMEMVTGGVNIGPVTSDFSNIFSVSADTITHRKILYTIYFRTSKYATPEEKMNNITVREFVLTPAQLSLERVNTVVKDVLIKIDCDEGFDKYDLFGHDYQTAETKEYYRFSGASCSGVSFAGLSDNIYEWFDYYCPSYMGNTFGTDAAHAHDNALSEMWDILPGYDMDFKSDPGNYTGVKHVKPLLSDAEINPNQTTGTFVYGTYSGSTATFGAFTSATQVSPWFTLGGSSMAPQTVVLNPSEGKPELEFIYELDRRGANVFNYTVVEEASKWGEYAVEGLEYNHPPAGTYPFRMKLMNHSDHANPDASPIRSKSFNLTIPY